MRENPDVHTEAQAVIANQSAPIAGPRTDRQHRGARKLTSVSAAYGTHVSVHRKCTEGQRVSATIMRSNDALLSATYQAEKKHKKSSQGQVLS